MDWDNDGRKDLLVGENNGNVRYFHNIGTAGNPQLTYVGLVQVRGVALDVGDYSVPWTDDWNGDGLFDLMVGESDGLIHLYPNSGTATSPLFNTDQYVLLASGSSLDVGYRSCPSVMDYNGDGVKDLVSGEMNGKVYFYENNGTNQAPLLADGVYLMTGTQQIAMAGTARPTPVDWDNDGDLDLVVGSYDAFLRRYMQEANTAAAPTCDINNTGSVLFPAAGGVLRYTVSAANANPTSVSFDLWTKMKNPDGSWTGPLINRQDMSLGPSQSITRDLLMRVQASWASGYYYMYLYVGDYNTNQIYDDDYLYFYKSATGAGLESRVTPFECSDWAGNFDAQMAAPLPEQVTLSANPNPFNPTTTLDFALPEAGPVKVAIYNAVGQRLATLVDGYRDAGRHQVTWDAASLPTGIYFAEVRAASQHTVHKLLLTK